MQPHDTALFGAFVRYEDVRDETTSQYFRGNQFSIDAFEKKYRATPDETYVQAIKRVCDDIASVEDTPEARDYWSARWFDEIYNDWWHPAGSITQGAGCGRKISKSNCTTLSLGTLRDDEEWDNLESIIRNTAYSVAKCAAYRQGLGVDFSRLRPAGTSVYNSASRSTGAVHWMKFIDSIGYFVGQHGRIPAMLFSLSCSHPDVIEFIGVKGDRTIIQNANISVQVTQAFYDAVEADADWHMVFDIPEVSVGDRVYLDGESATTDCLVEQREGHPRRFYRLATHRRPAERFVRVEKARLVLEMIARNMHLHAEPGIQNIDLARRLSNSDYVYDPLDEYDSRIVSSNACSEQYLSLESLCVLASQNSARFSSDWALFERQQQKIASSMNHFLDNVNEAELRSHTYATPRQRLAIEKLRRTGAGYTNLDGWLFKMGLEYGSPEAVEAVRRYTERFNYHLYAHSIENGRNKGSFGLFDRDKLERSPFIQRMMALGLTFDALRNVTCSSIAPAGTLSLMFREEVMSYGAEPGFGTFYWKRTRISGKYEYYFCVPSVVRQVFAERGHPLPMDSDSIKDTWDGKHGKKVVAFIEEWAPRLGIRLRKSTDVSPTAKLDMMSAMMENIDSSISITYMLPEGTDWKDIYDFILLANKKGVKSIAAFPDRQMYGIVSYEPFKELALRLTRQGIPIHPQNFTEEEARQLGDFSTGHIAKTTAPKRPRDLPCDLYVFTARGRKFTVAVGLLDGDPYEVMAAENLVVDATRGVLRKHKKGVYHLLSTEGDILCEDFSSRSSEDEEGLARMVSTALRHGADVHFVADQLSKTRGALQSLARVLARALKKYLRDQVVHQACPDCGMEPLTREEGCVRCTNCGYSKCS